jgi:hypothetical protein
LAAIEPRQNEEVVALDNGEIPGDRLGNWNCVNLFFIL